MRGSRKKSRRFLILFFLLIGSVFLLIRFPFHQKDSYVGKPYKYEELVLLFQNQKPMFDRVVQIISSNETFWKNAREYEDSGHADILSPNDTETMNLFNKRDQDTLNDFFNKTKPYEISLRNRRSVTITYFNEDQTDNFDFTCYYDRTTENIYGRTYYEDWLSDFKNSCQDFTELGGDWFLYGKKSFFIAQNANPSALNSTGNKKRTASGFVKSMAFTFF